MRFEVYGVGMKCPTTQVECADHPRHVLETLQKAALVPGHLCQTNGDIMERLSEDGGGYEIYNDEGDLFLTVRPIGV